MKSSSPPAHGLTEGKEYTLKLGPTFQNGARAQESYHVLRYDFKPASIDTSQPAEVKFGSNKECFVTYPNHEHGSITFKGGRKPMSKECVLVIDKTTGEITLERISSNIPLKKSRTGTVERPSGDIRKGASNTPVSNPKQKVAAGGSGAAAKSHGSKETSASNPTGSSHHSEPSSHAQGTPHSSQPTTTQQQHHHHHKQHVNKQPAPKAAESKPKDTSGSSSSDSDSSDSDSSDSDSDIAEHVNTLESRISGIQSNEPPPPPQIPKPNKETNVFEDLHLSDTNSDSDSD